MYEDKRLYPRFLFSEPVAYSQPQITVDGAVAHNISLSGLSIRVQGFIPVGSLLEIQLRLGQASGILWTKAKVIRIGEILAEDCYEIGLKFVQDEECIRAVGAYINASRSNQQTK